MNPDVAESVVQRTNWTVIQHPSSYLTRRFNATSSGRSYWRCTPRKNFGNDQVHTYTVTFSFYLYVNIDMNMVWVHESCMYQKLIGISYSYVSSTLTHVSFFQVPMVSNGAKVAP